MHRFTSQTRRAAFVALPANIVLSLLLVLTSSCAQSRPPASATQPAVADHDSALRWHTLQGGNFEIDGLPWYADNHGKLSRLPESSKSTFRSAVWSLAQCPSGARVRFRTNSAVLTIRLEYSSPPNMANMHAFGQTGVDLYLDGEYHATATAPRDAAEGKTVETRLLDFSDRPRATHDVVLYLPLYKPVRIVGIGLDPDAKIEKPKPFALAKPLVFYGTSITQGGCASRPGLSYQAILARKLNLDFVNLGFSGNGLGEPAVARAVASIDASAYILDFGANHKTSHDMEQVYEPFLKAIRSAHPNIPIIVMTPLFTARELRSQEFKADWQHRRSFIENIVNQHIAAGDSHLILVDGARLLDPSPGDCLVDGMHPNDLGFYRMAEKLIPFIRKAVSLPEHKETPAQANARIVPPLSQWRDKIASSLHSTHPDYVVYVPNISSDAVTDTGNEHFLVFDGPDHSLMAIWTQSTREGEPDQHIVFSQSLDHARTWTKPRIIAGPAKPGESFMASWAFPMVSTKGRIYVLYSQSVGKFDTFAHTTGQLTGIYSDDAGATWSGPQAVPVPRTSRENPDVSFPANCITWQKPLRLTRDNKYFVGLTRWTSKAVKKNPTNSWVSHDSVVEFMRFDNVDDNLEPGNLKISFFASDRDAIQVPLPGHPEISVCQEPSIVKLPDGRFFCVMRTMTGSPWWTLSSDDGQTWSPPRPLLDKDFGQPLKHPISPCPIFDLAGPGGASGNYCLFIHNHDGHYQGFTPLDTQMNRRPIFKVIGHFRPAATQPIWFDSPQFFFDHDGLLLGPPGKLGRLDLALYSSTTRLGDKTILWYPDRKFFLLGRIITP